MTDVADADKEVESWSAWNLAIVANRKEQHTVAECHFTPEQAEEMGGDPMVDNHVLSDAEHLLAQQEDEVEEQYQLQDELTRANKDIARLRKVAIPALS